MKNIRILGLIAVLAVPTGLQSQQLTWFENNHPITYEVSKGTAPVVGVALDMLCSDLQQVTGVKPQAVKSGKKATLYIVELDKAKGEAKALAQMGVPVDSLKARKEAFFVKALPETSQLLVVGSDARGTAYGILEISRLAGVSPWIWWGDAVPEHRDRLTVDSHYETLQSPSVEFRGIFLNDEDWTLQPWSWQKFDPARPGMMTVNTYRQIFRQMLRLRANMIWPGMHGMSVPFYLVPGAKECADSCGIVIGTSHCEPLMRNNVGEWKVAERGDYNFISNRESVINYWTERLREAGQYENFYTLGMRGIHDSDMEGVTTEREKVDALNQVISVQRKLLEQYVVNDKKARKARGYQRVEDVPQVFVPYKEVLQIMEAGVNIPDDVTLMWCDDNYGYMTRLSDSIQQQRKGGAGIYYHLSYWGRPMDYLWLSTMQPGLIYNEMRQAYRHHVRKLWIVNVHDLKAPCYDLEYFLDLAWNIDSPKPDQHLEQWLTREFGSETARRLFPYMCEYYRLTAIRKPEFMGWNQVELDKNRWERGRSAVANTEFSFTEPGNGGEAAEYLAAYRNLRDGIESLAPAKDDPHYASYFAHILYPVEASAYMAEKMLYAQQARLIADGEYHEQRWQRDTALYVACARSQFAYQQIRSLTRYYNDSLSNGKWKGMMNAEPRDLYQFWAPVIPMQLTDAEVEHWLKPGSSSATPSYTRCLSRKAADYSGISGKAETIPLLGHSNAAVAVEKGSALEYKFDTDTTGTAMLTVALIPTQANDKGDIRFSVSLDGAEPTVYSLQEPFRSERWKENVLRQQARRTLKIDNLSAGRHTLTLKALDDHIVFDQWMIDYNTERKFYMIPLCEEK